MSNVFAEMSIGMIRRGLTMTTQSRTKRLLLYAAELLASSRSMVILFGIFPLTG